MTDFEIFYTFYGKPILSNTLIQNRPGSRNMYTTQTPQNPNFPTETEKTEAETLHTKTTKSKTIQLIYRVEENPRLLDQTKPQKKHNKYEIQWVFDLRASGRLAWFEEAGDNKMHFLHSWY